MSALSPIRPTRSFIPLAMHTVDSLLLLCSFPMVQWALGEPTHEHSFVLGLVGCVVVFLVGEAAGLYRPSRGRSADSEVIMTAFTWIGTVIAMLFIGMLTRTTETYSRLSLISWFFIGGLSLMCSHMLFRGLLEWMLSHGVGTKKTAIVGINRLGQDIARNAKSATDCGLNIVGFYDDRGDSRLEDHKDWDGDFRGNSDQLLHDIQSGLVDHVLIALPLRAEKRIQNVLDKLANTTASVYIVPDFFVFELLHSRWTQVGGLPVVSVFESPIYGVDGLMKRCLDLLLSLVGLLMISPVLIVCALLVKLSSKGPVFFRQKRYGLDGKEILVWKFRSMYTCDNGPVVKQATKNDPRVTPIGAILRKTSLDELPQLFNVIEGSMSLVGPRPHANAHNEHFRTKIRGYMMRHKVKPGITGLAQVEGSRGETDTVEKMERRIELDHRYIREWSLWLDLKILFRTVFVVLKQDAY